MAEKQKQKPKYPILDKIWIYLKPFLNWRFLICFGMAWIITNGIWYVIAFAPIAWMPVVLSTFARGYIIFIWAVGPEKIITIPMAIWFLVKIFKNHTKTRISLDRMYDEAKKDWNKFKNWWRRKKDV